MESTIDVLKNRRSVKSFKDNQISKEDLESILSAAKNAPSGMNLQSPKILVIQRKRLLNVYPSGINHFIQKKLWILCLMILILFITLLPY